MVIPNSSMIATDTFLAPPLTRGAGGVKSVASETEIGIKGRKPCAPTDGGSKVNLRKSRTQ